jgi:hypothetical protein
MPKKVDFRNRISDRLLVYTLHDPEGQKGNSGWYFGDKKVFEQSLDLKLASTCTWNSKAVKAGGWKVDVTDEAGAELSSVSFTVK